MIVGIQTNGIGKMNVGNANANSVKSRTEDKASDIFAGLMNLSVQTVQTGERNVQTRTDAAVTVSSGKAVFSADTSYSEIPEKAPERTTDDQTAPTKTDTPISESRKPEEKAGVEQTDSKRDAGGDEAPTDKAQGELAEKLKQLLGLDDERLQQLLADAGLTMQELLNPDVLKQFVLQINDASSVDMLINEDLNRTVNQLLQALDGILTDNGLVTEAVPEVLVAEETVQVLEPEAEREMAEYDTVTARPETADAAPEKTEEVRDLPETQRTGQEPQNTEAQIKVTVQTQNGGQTGGQDSQMSRGDDTILANLNQALQQTVGGELPEVNGFSESVTQADILRQVVDEIRLSMSRDVQTISVQLNPEQLGKVQIHVATKNGVMQAQIIAENEAAKNAVESGLSVLREAFENQDLKVDAIEVMVGTHDYFAESGQDAQDDDGRREKTGNRSDGINLNDISDDEVSEDRQLEIEMMKAQGNRVNYTA